MKTKKQYTVKAWNAYSFNTPEKCSLIIGTNYLAYDENHAIKQALVDARKWNKGEKNTDKRVNVITCNGHYANV